MLRFPNPLVPVATKSLWEKVNSVGFAFVTALPMSYLNMFEDKVILVSERMHGCLLDLLTVDYPP